MMDVKIALDMGLMVLSVVSGIMPMALVFGLFTGLSQIWFRMRKSKNPDEAQKQAKEMNSIIRVMALGRLNKLFAGKTGRNSVNSCLVGLVDLSDGVNAMERTWMSLYFIVSYFVTVMVLSVLVNSIILVLRNMATGSELIEADSGKLFVEIFLGSFKLFWTFLMMVGQAILKAIEAGKDGMGTPAHTGSLLKAIVNQGV